MKKFLSMLLVLCFVVTATSFGLAFDTTTLGSSAKSSQGTDLTLATLSNGVGTDLQNEYASYNFPLNHNVDRISKIKFQPQAAVIEGTGGTIIAQITVKNNTLDGFKLVVHAANGVLKPSGDSVDKLDKEDDIPYFLKIVATGKKGIGVDNTYTIDMTDTTSDAAKHVLNVASLQSTPTDLILDVSVDVDSTEEDKMGMAGNYSDTVTFTYIDL